MFRRVALVRTDVSEKVSASFIRVTRIGELGTTLAVTSNQRGGSEGETYSRVGLVIFLSLQEDVSLEMFLVKVT
jgi:hypothetical protein